MSQSKYGIFPSHIFKLIPYLEHTAQLYYKIVSKVTNISKFQYMGENKIFILGCLWSF